MKSTFVNKILAKLDLMDVGDYYSKPDLVLKYWGRQDEFAVDCFNVAFCNARKLTDKKFKVRSKKITRIA